MKKIPIKKKSAGIVQATNVAPVQWHSFEDVLKKASRAKTFSKVYDEELARLALAKTIRELRALSHLTQKGVAERAGMPQSVIARLESGEHGVSLDTLNKIATVFGKRVALV
jgi:DNA-binding XRE family transcriptional regulator